MISEEHVPAPGLEDNPPVRGVLDRWAESLAQVLQSMTDHRPTVEWHLLHEPRCGLGAWGKLPVFGESIPEFFPRAPGDCPGPAQSIA